MTRNNTASMRNGDWELENELENEWKCHYFTHMGANKTFFYLGCMLASFPPAKKVKNLGTTHSMVEERNWKRAKRGSSVAWPNYRLFALV